MIDSELIHKIENFVFIRPRSVQEISEHIRKNWRTADRYVEKIAEEFGTIAFRIFREGTRGALKVVYANSVDKISSTVFQEELERQIFNGRNKFDFSPFDIFQHVKDSKKEVEIYEGKDEDAIKSLKGYKELLLKTKKQLLFFSGNLSFVNFNDGNIFLFDCLEELVKRDIKIKIIARIDIGAIGNVKKLLSLNYKYGKELVEIRHKENPLRVTIIDDSILHLKEIKEPTGRVGEINEKTFLFYTILEKEWIEWATKIFYKMYNTGIGSEKRLKELEKIMVFR